jgi:hypothetical protein
MYIGRVLDKPGGFREYEAGLLAAGEKGVSVPLFAIMLTPCLCYCRKERMFK